MVTFPFSHLQPACPALRWSRKICFLILWDLTGFCNHLQSFFCFQSTINLYPSNLQFSILQYITPTGFWFFRGTSFIYKHTTPPGLVIFQSYYFVPVCLWRNLSLPFRPFVVFNQPSTFIHQTFNHQSSILPTAYSLLPTDFLLSPCHPSLPTCPSSLSMHQSFNPTTPNPHSPIFFRLFRVLCDSSASG